MNIEQKELILETVDNWFSENNNKWRNLTKEEILCIQLLNKKINFENSKKFLERIKIKEDKYISIDIEKEGENE